MKKNISRKNFIKNSALTMAGLPFGLSSLAAISKLQDNGGKQGPFPPIKDNGEENKLSISVFSKNLQWLDYKDMARLAAQLGFDGIDLTVRPGGHVVPERVTDDLPKAVETIKQAGLKVYNIATDIKSAADKYTADILKTASHLGLKNYRMGWYNYDSRLDTLSNVEIFKKRFIDLSAINEYYHIHGDYENHTGYFGGPLWDLWLVLKDLNPQWIGCQFDIRHATVDGAEAWPVNLNLLQKYIGSLTLKDFIWKKVNNKWTVENVPLGQGMVDFKQYFTIIKKYSLQRSLTLHFEYPLGGADTGATKLTIPKDDVIKAMRTDLHTLKQWLKEYELL